MVYRQRQGYYCGVGQLADGIGSTWHLPEYPVQARSLGSFRPMATTNDDARDSGPPLALVLLPGQCAGCGEKEAFASAWECEECNAGLACDHCGRCSAHPSCTPNRESARDWVESMYEADHI
ncbi:hypothetical protein GCM10010329_50040 [Streptomyces spiroverticillatus]|uniref:Uncharacterized protein n=1 Tax=Streptomyces finlayi TaxID=67296 RepID=A0A918X1G5_9ACTN|nr:hypothetical protein GCM10010329_50040 [Streptomyces spiroverticillatus]GHD03343.1 hypothetical protein GCM10010334_50990 [Streptomyces finlayi]